MPSETRSPRPEAAGEAASELVRLMARLRAECPWDRKQTFADLSGYLLEECYEALDALAREDLGELEGELETSCSRSSSSPSSAASGAPSTSPPSPGGSTPRWSPATRTSSARSR